MKSLSPEDAVVANKVWPNRHEGSEFLLNRLAEFNLNIGAYDKESNELLAWCFRLQAGPLGALQTKESAYRRGLGSLVTRSMCKQLNEIGHDAYGLVKPTNYPSRGTFEKVGFTMIGKAYWIRNVPTFDFHWTD